MDKRLGGLGFLQHQYDHVARPPGEIDRRLATQRARRCKCHTAAGGFDLKRLVDAAAVLFIDPLDLGEFHAHRLQFGDAERVDLGVLRFEGRRDIGLGLLFLGSGRRLLFLIIGGGFRLLVRGLCLDGFCLLVGRLAVTGGGGIRSWLWGRNFLRQSSCDEKKNCWKQ